MNSWHLLVVEDDPDGQEVVSRILNYHRIPYDTVGSAEDALHLLTENPTYTGCLIDLALPAMDGWRLLQTIQQEMDDLPCVAMTAYHSAEVGQKALEAGFVGYFPKPLNTSSFMRDLENMF